MSSLHDIRRHDVWKHVSESLGNPGCRVRLYFLGGPLSRTPPVKARPWKAYASPASIVTLVPETGDTNQCNINIDQTELIGQFSALITELVSYMDESYRTELSRFKEVLTGKQSVPRDRRPSMRAVDLVFRDHLLVQATLMSRAGGVSVQDISFSVPQGRRFGEAADYVNTPRGWELRDMWKDAPLDDPRMQYHKKRDEARARAVLRSISKLLSTGHAVLQGTMQVSGYQGPYQIELGSYAEPSLSPAQIVAATSKDPIAQRATREAFRASMKIRQAQEASGRHA